MVKANNSISSNDGNNQSAIGKGGYIASVGPNPRQPISDIHSLPGHELSWSQLLKSSLALLSGRVDGRITFIPLDHALLQIGFAAVWLHLARAVGPEEIANVSNTDSTATIPPP